MFGGAVWLNYVGLKDPETLLCSYSRPDGAQNRKRERKNYEIDSKQTENKRMNKEEMIHQIPTHYTGSEWKWNCEQAKKRRSSPDHSHTLHMWLWLTFHLSLALPLSIHPSLLASLSGCQPCFSARRQSFAEACISSSHLLNIYPLTS